MNLLCTAVAAVATLTAHSGAQDTGDWPQFRGPGGLSLADDTPIPMTLGPDQSVRWKTAVPPGHSSPCIVGERIFLTGYEEDRNVVVALDRASGDVLWTRSFEGTPIPDYFHPDAGPAVPTAASDGNIVVAYFGTYGLVALDLDGNPQWELRLSHPPGSVFGIGTSPILHDGLVILSRDATEEAGILVLDAEDGAELWRMDRFEFGDAHGTPFLWRNADRVELVVGGTNRLCSYDLDSAELLWSVDGLTNFPCTTPVADQDTLYYAAWSTPNSSGRSFWEAAFARSLELSDEEIADPSLLFARLDVNEDGRIVPDEVPECRAKDAFAFLDGNFNGSWELQEMVEAEGQAGAPGRNLMVAVARGAEGDASKDSVRWSWSRGLPYVASPLLHRGRIWLFKSGGLVTCLDATTGTPILDRERLDDRSEYYMSPVGVGGHVLVGSAEGSLYLIDADADELKVTHKAQFDEPLFATPAVLEGTVYLRTTSALWAFAETQD